MASNMTYFRLTARQKAEAAGQKTYQGKRCLRGHPGIRRTSNGHCLECELKPPHKSSRQEAKAAGQKTYQGSPCPYGHSGLRRTCNKKCIECDKQEKRDQAEYFQLYHRVWVNRSPENLKCQKAWVKRSKMRNAIKNADQDAHRRAVQQNTIKLLYYGTL